MTDRSSPAATNPFDRVDVSDWVEVELEPGGSTPGRWLKDPVDGTQWLNKDTVIPANGHEQGEDWSEILSTRVAELLEVPCAVTRLCLREGRRGSLSLNVRPDDVDLNEGVVALEECDEVTDYVPHRDLEHRIGGPQPSVRRPGYTVENIRRALEHVAAPPGFSGTPALDAFDVFAGYLILDALIANRDRHDENWSVLTPRLMNQRERLAPSYDHASSLGYQLTDTTRERCLGDRRALERWARNGTAWRFEHRGKPQSLVDLAVDALAMSSEQGRAHWRKKIAELDLGPVYGVLGSGAIPAMSEAASRFAEELLKHNLERIGHAIARLD
ncbi:MAG: hypothetical protein ACTMIR_06190 [Cellulomonadaceae bacterium]